MINIGKKMSNYKWGWIKTLYMHQVVNETIRKKIINRLINGFNNIIGKVPGIITKITKATQWVANKI